MTLETYEQLLVQIDHLAERLDREADENLKEVTRRLLTCIDLLHREPLRRLVQLLERRDPDVFALMTKDPVIQKLLALYELVPSTAETAPGEPLILTARRASDRRPGCGERVRPETDR